MDTAGSLMLSLNHANQRIRCMALMKLFDYIENNTIKVTKLDWTPLLIVRFVFVRIKSHLKQFNVTFFKEQ